MLKEDRQIIWAAMLATLIIGGASWAVLAPRAPRFAGPEAIGVDNPAYVPGGEVCWQHRALARQRCLQAVEEHRLRRLEIAQQIRSAEADEAAASLMFAQTRLMLLAMVGGLLTLVAAAFAGWYARSAAREARRSSDAASEGLTHSRNVAQTQLRAYVDVCEVKCHMKRGFLEITFLLKNFGQTPAIDNEVWQGTAFKGPKWKEAGLPAAEEHLRSAGTIPPGHGRLSRIEVTDMKTVRAIASGESPLTLGITVRYSYRTVGEDSLEQEETHLIIGKAQLANGRPRYLDRQDMA